MKFFLKNFIFFLLITTSLLANIGFYNPISTTGDSGTPNLSDSTQNAGFSEIQTNSSGQFIYSIWLRNDGINNIVQTAKSSDYGLNWTNPITTTGDGGSPNLSVNALNIFDCHITTNDTGKYVYSIWASGTIVQTAKSSDFGINWTNPVSTPTGTVVPNLSLLGNSVTSPQIITNASGKYVYAVWVRSNGANDIIQTSISSDYGLNWTYPITTTGDGGSPNLSDDGQDATLPQISTSSDGKYVYAIWSRNFIIQVAKSSNFGKTWTIPTATPVGINTFDLTLGNTILPRIATSSDGKYVYATWSKSNGPTAVIQTAISSDFGENWTDPISTPKGTSIPDLSENNLSSFYPKIKTNDNGKSVYIVWEANDGSNDYIQLAKSQDYGKRWTVPSATIIGYNTSNIVAEGIAVQMAIDSIGKNIYITWAKVTSPVVIQMAQSNDWGNSWSFPEVTPTLLPPNLSINDFDAATPQITTDNLGQYVYLNWIKSDGANNIIQTASSFSLLYKAYSKNLLFQKDFINELYWAPPFPSNTIYRLYKNSPSNLIYEGNAKKFMDHGNCMQNKCASVQNVYYLSWLDNLGNESPLIKINIP